MLKILLLLSLSSVVVFAQEHHCAAPSYFEATILQYDHYTNYYRRGKIFYDAFRKRVRLIEKTSEMETRPTVDMLLLFEEKKNYTINMKTGKCHQSQTEGEFHRIGIEKGDHFAQDMTIGVLPHDGVELSVWIRYENTTSSQGMHIHEFTHDHCIPFYHSFEGSHDGHKVHYHSSYFNVVTQVSDPDIFMVPKEC
uniref:uncharacterized protein LOC120344972 n=1 Tax=Styela clava TaxID=7725 RepID=UPI00193A91EA|nr:uncharacterized protein LOC120344972 [Styela clava]